MHDAVQTVRAVWSRMDELRHEARVKRMKTERAT
jgi:hypothetical protein